MGAKAAAKAALTAVAGVLLAAAILSLPELIGTFYVPGFLYAVIVTAAIWSLSGRPDGQG